MGFNKLGMEAAAVISIDEASSKEDGNRLAQQELKTLQSIYTYGNKLSKSTNSNSIQMAPYEAMFSDETKNSLHFIITKIKLA